MFFKGYWLLFRAKIGIILHICKETAGFPLKSMFLKDGVAVIQPQTKRERVAVIQPQTERGDDRRWWAVMGDDGIAARSTALNIVIFTLFITRSTYL
jgi:hypothetical protein